MGLSRGELGMKNISIRVCGASRSARVSAILQEEYFDEKREEEGLKHTGRLAWYEVAKKVLTGLSG